MLACKLRDLPSVEENDNTCIPLLLIDTIGCSLYEMELDDELSKGNEGRFTITFYK